MLTLHDDGAREADARDASRTRSVASLATALAEAVLVGDKTMAMVLAQTIRELESR